MSTPTDPLVDALIKHAEGVYAEGERGTMAGMNAEEVERDAIAARLSAVLAAARVVILNPWPELAALRDAIAAADAEVAP